MPVTQWFLTNGNSLKRIHIPNHKNSPKTQQKICHMAFFLQLHMTFSRIQACGNFWGKFHAREFAGKTLFFKAFFGRFFPLLNVYELRLLEGKLMHYSYWKLYSNSYSYITQENLSFSEKVTTHRLHSPTFFSYIFLLIVFKIP